LPDRRRHPRWRRLRRRRRLGRGAAPRRRGGRPGAVAPGRDSRRHVGAERDRGEPRLPDGVKKRLDVLLVERGLAESRAQAQALVMAGLVRGHSKAGEQLDENAELEVEAPPPYVSRAGHKLANALDAFRVDVTGLDALDVG